MPRKSPLEIPSLLSCPYKKEEEAVVVLVGGHSFQYKVVFTMDRLSFHYQTQRGEIATGRVFFFFLLVRYKLLPRSALLVCCFVPSLQNRNLI